jgi:hypothetical protein
MKDEVHCQIYFYAHKTFQLEVLQLKEGLVLRSSNSYFAMLAFWVVTPRGLAGSWSAQ